MQTYLIATPTETLIDKIKESHTLMPDPSTCSMKEDLQTKEEPLPMVEEETGEGEEIMEDIKAIEEPQQDQMSNQPYPHTTDTNLCSMKILLITKEHQTQRQIKQNKHHKGNEMNVSETMKDLTNEIKYQGTSNLHMNNNMTQSIPKEGQQKAHRTLGNKGPMVTTEICNLQVMNQ